MYFLTSQGGNLSNSVTLKIDLLIGKVYHQCNLINSLRMIPPTQDQDQVDSESEDMGWSYMIKEKVINSLLLFKKYPSTLGCQ